MFEVELSSKGTQLSAVFDLMLVFPLLNHCYSDIADLQTILTCECAALDDTVYDCSNRGLTAVPHCIPDGAVSMYIMLKPFECPACMS